jgi:hypothetical protein
MRQNHYHYLLDNANILVYNENMVFLPKTKWARFATAVYMAAAIMGTFTFALTDSFPDVGLGKDELTPSGIFAPIDYAVGCLAEGNGVTGKAGKYSSSLARNNFLRIDVLIGLQNMGTLFSHVSLRAIEATNHLDKKNTILLKLRI